jgi:hypothetical protein
MKNIIILAYLLVCILSVIPSKACKIIAVILSLPFFLFGSAVAYHGGLADTFTYKERFLIFIIVSTPIILTISSITIQKLFTKIIENKKKRQAGLQKSLVEVKVKR